MRKWITFHIVSTTKLLKALNLVTGQSFGLEISSQDMQLVKAKFTFALTYCEYIIYKSFDKKDQSGTTD